MRTRIFLNEFDPGYYKIADTLMYQGSNAWANQPVLMYPKSQKFSAMVDVVTRKFKSKRNAGEIINNPMWKVTYQRAEKPSIASGNAGGAGGYTEWKLGNIPVCGIVVDTKDPSAAVNAICEPYHSESVIAQTKAWANIDLSEMQAITSLGELPETVEMIVSILKTVYRSFFACKRGDLGRMRKELKSLKKLPQQSADLWLMWRYGVRPLAGEVQSLLAAISAKPLVGGRKTFRARFIPEIPDPALKRSHANWSHGGAGWDFRTTVRENRSYRAGVLVQIEQDINSAVAIFGLDNPFGAAYELLPCSFILDWFLNVGDTIAAMVGHPSLSPVLSFVVEEITSATICTCTGYSQFPDGTGIQTATAANGSLLVEPGYVNTFVTARRRIPLAERYNLPRLNLKLDMAKLLDLALIARQLTN